MGRTVNSSRRRDRLRHRPHLENLDDRCLLSVGLDSHLAQVAATHRERPAGMILGVRPEAMKEKGAKFVVRNHGHTEALRERPAGTMASSAAGTYDPVIGASQVQSNYNVNGSGMTVAVIDTGVDYNNPALGSGFGPGAKVIAGYDFSNNSTNPMATTSQHGTGVAGLIGSTNAQDPGVAPGVNIVALKVTDGTNTASLDSIARALQWVIDNHAQYNITVVNLSLSDGQNYAHNWFATTGGTPEQVTNLIGQLRGMNIPVAVATGNNFSGAQGEGFAAIVQGTISVTATDLSGHLLPDAQRLGASIGGTSATVIAAPGENMHAPYGDNGTASVEGTSFATPLVSGAIVLLQQIYEQRFGTLPTVDQITGWLQQGSDPIYDPATGITVGQLDIPKAAALVPTAQSTPAPSQTVTNIQVSTATVVPTPSSGVTQTVTTTTASTPPAPPSTPPAAPPTPPAAPSTPPAAPPTPPAAPPTPPAAPPTPPAAPPTPPAPPSIPPASPAQSPAPVPSSTQVLSDSPGGSNGFGASQPISGLARLFQNMRVWSASSASRR